MPRYAKSLAVYTDVETVFQTALRNNGCIYQLPTPAEAASWRHRAYAYRRLLAELTIKSHGPAFAATPYDAFILTIDPERPNEIRIQTRRPLGNILTLDNASVPTPDLLAELEDEAQKLLKEL